MLKEKVFTIFSCTKWPRKK